MIADIVAVDIAIITLTVILSTPVGMPQLPFLLAE